MIIQRQADTDLRPDQVRAMAHGLYAFALINGITDTEKDLIQSFLKQGDVELDVDSLANIPFSLDSLLYSLDTLFLRKTFLRVCILMAQADGVVSPEETAELRRIAQVMGIGEPVEELAADLEGMSLV